jgi:glycosyltransferase involved in cell wall biosynthesis
MALNCAVSSGVPRVLYVVYWGAGEPLGQALVLPSVKRLAADGVRITLVTFDKSEDLERTEEIARIRDDLRSREIRWISLRYLKRPQAPAKLWDAFCGWARSIAAQLEERADIVHARTFFGGLMGMALAPLLRARLIYHNEGFYPDEQVDGGVWAADSMKHRVGRYLERQLYGRADGIIALSERARCAIEKLPAVKRKQTTIVVVPSAVDLRRFQCPSERMLPKNGLKLVYAGSIGARYRFESAVQFANAALRELGQVHLRVLTRQDKTVVEGLLDSSGLPRETWSVGFLPHEEIPAELTRHEAGLYFVTPGSSAAGTSPTRVGEYWACGLPVVITRDVSDTQEVIMRERVGVLVREESDVAYREAARELHELLADKDIRARCRRAAEAHYALEPACDRQLALYRQIL